MSDVIGERMTIKGRLHFGRQIGKLLANLTPFQSEIMLTPMSTICRTVVLLRGAVCNATTYYSLIFYLWAATARFSCISLWVQRVTCLYFILYYLLI